MAGVELRKPVVSDYLWLLLLSVVWSASFAFIKVAVFEIPPFFMTFGRLLSASCAMGLIYYVLVFRRRLRGFAVESLWRLFMRIGLLASLAAFTGSALPFSLIALGETRIDSALAAVLMGVMPLLTVLLAHMTTDDEPLTRGKVLGLCCAFFGVLVLTGYDVLRGLGEEVFFQLLIISGAFSYGVNTLIMRRLSSYDRISVSFLIIALSAIMMVVPVFFEGCFAFEGWRLVSFWAWFSMVFLGVVQSALATLIMFRILHHCGAGFFSQVNYLIPLFGMSWGVLFLSEAFRWEMAIALALILLGIALARQGSQKP